MTKISYELYHSLEREQWEVWKTVRTERGINTKCVFRGNKKECQSELKRYRNELL